MAASPMDTDEGQSSYLYEAGLYSDPRYLSSTTIADVNKATRLPLVVFNSFLILLSITAFWASMALVLHRSGPVPAALPSDRTNRAVSKSLVFTLVERPEILAFLVYGFLFVTAAVGLVGGLRENVCLLTTHAVLVGVLASVAIVMALLSVTLMQRARNYVKYQMSGQLIASYRHSEDLQAMMDWIQINYKCCGISGDTYRDWSLNPYFLCDRDNLSKERCGVPSSCCRRNDSGAQEMVVNALCGAKVLQFGEQEAWKKVYTRSCADAVFAHVRQLSVPIAIGFFLVAVLSLLLLTLALSVRGDINLLSAIYGVYYKHASEGHKKILDVEGSMADLPPPAEKTSFSAKQLWTKFRDNLQTLPIRYR